ncbi:MAG: insulinase family protein [Clostridium sp.]|nr:insulinase family protein [Clostridium sp.]
MKLRHLLVSISIVTAIPMNAQSGLTSDPALRQGKLDNGLTYYILPTKNSGQRADFFLARSVGSIHEEEDQRGLAHFLEHLCFNGTKHFPGNSVISYLESVGVKFGKNLNASTNTDRTIYNISKVPTTRQSTLDSCLLILRDWSGDVTLADGDIEAERGVIHEEWRQRNSASNRMLERATPRLFAGSRYANRMPIGLMSVVDSFPPQRLRDFYADWHRPSTEAVIVVGDVDANHIEAEIKRLFADLPAGSSKLLPSLEIPVNDKFMAVVETDPEQPVEMLSLYFKYPAVGGLSAEEAMKHELLSDILCNMLVNRLDNVELRDGAVCSNVGVGDQKFLLASPLKALTFRTKVLPGHSAEALTDLYTEVRRAIVNGFETSELEAAKSAALSSLRAADNKASLRSTTDLAQRLVRTYLDGERFDTPASRLELARTMLPSITENDVVDYLKSIVSSSGKNAVALLYMPTPAEGEKGVSEKELSDAFYAVNDIALESFKPVKVNATLLAKEPKKGKVKKSKQLGKWNTEVLTLSNGIKVYMRPSKDNEDQIFVRGIGYGGFSQKYTPELAPTMKLMEEIIPLSGFGDLSSADLRRFMHGRDMKVSTAISQTEETMELASGREDLEEAFRLMYLKATDIRPDNQAFNAMMNQKRATLAKQFKNPIQVMGDSITAIVYSHQPLGGKFVPSMIEKVDYNTALDIYRDRFSDFSDFSFFVTGDYDRKQIVDLLERYVASLPAKGRKETPKDIGYRFVEGKDLRVPFTVPMETPQSVVYQFRHLQCPYTLENILMASAVGQVLKSRLLSDIREDKGWTYSITGHGAVTNGMNGQDPAEFMMPTYVKTSPEHSAEVSESIIRTLNAMAGMGDGADAGAALGNGGTGVDVSLKNTAGVTDAELATIREYFMKSIQDNRGDNAYWLVALRALDKFGLDLDSGYEEAVSAITPENMQAFMKTYVLPADRLILTMMPE